MSLKQRTLVEIYAGSEDDEDDLKLVYGLSRDIAGNGELVIHLVDMNSSLKLLSLQFIQIKMVRVFVAALEGSLKTNVIVIPPIPRRKSVPSQYLQPAIVISSVNGTPKELLQNLSKGTTKEQLGNLPPFPTVEEREQEKPLSVHSEGCLGGTFDRLHAGHKLMLAVASIACKEKLYVGLTDVSMLHSKKYVEMIQSFDERKRVVTDCLKIINPDLDCQVRPLLDPWGPAVVIKEISCIIVSKETLRGAEQINAKRMENKMCSLEVFVIAYVPPPRSLLSNLPVGSVDVKLSSTALRKEETST